MKNLVEKILRNSPDPLNVRKSTAVVFNNLALIKIDINKLAEIAELINQKIDKKQLLNEEQFGSSTPSPQLIFVLDTLNFCFWAKKDAEKWTVEYPRG
ncbi:MAG: queuosine salvage family protein, partial [bacterium]